MIRPFDRNRQHLEVPSGRYAGSAVARLSSRSGEGPQFVPVEGLTDSIVVSAGRGRGFRMHSAVRTSLEDPGLACNGLSYQRGESNPS